MARGYGKKEVLTFGVNLFGDGLALGSGAYGERHRVEAVGFFCRGCKREDWLLIEAKL